MTNHGNQIDDDYLPPLKPVEGKEYVLSTRLMRGDQVVCYATSEPLSSREVMDTAKLQYFTSVVTGLLERARTILLGITSPASAFKKTHELTAQDLRKLADAVESGNPSVLKVVGAMDPYKPGHFVIITVLKNESNNRR
jgi:hypothetical protein